MSMIPLTSFLVAPLSGRLSDRSGTQGLAVAGGVAGTLGFLLMGGVLGRGVGPQSTALEIGLLMSLIGLATGLFQSPNNSAIMGAVPHGKLGTASALLATIRNLGIATGTGLAAGVFSLHFSSNGDYVEALHFVFMISAAIALLATIVSSLKRKRMQSEVARESELIKALSLESEEDDEDIPIDFESQEPITVTHQPQRVTKPPQQ
jgi:MFS family permease